MNVRDTSLEAYDDLKVEGILGAQQSDIMELFVLYRNRDFTRSEIAHETGIRLSAVCGRVNELIKAGHLVDDDRRQCRITGRSCHAVKRAK